jgi:hypothetical protein
VELLVLVGVEVEVEDLLVAEVLEEYHYLLLAALIQLLVLLLWLILEGEEEDIQLVLI